jgi:phosphate-selective porin
MSLTAAAQDKLTGTESRSEIEVLRREFDASRAEIEKLREELRREGDLRRQQQDLLDQLLKRLDDLTAAAKETKTNSTDTAKAPVTGATSTAAAAINSNVSSTTKQQDKPVNAVESGFGKVKFTGFIQGWFAAGDRAFADTFRVRRAELRFTGDLLPKVRWSVMFDLAKTLSLNTTTAAVDGTPVVRTVSVNQSSRIFQEAFVTLGYFKQANIQVGQYKVPLSQEGLQSTAALDTVERALFMSDRSRGGALGDIRELGAMVFGPLGQQVDYQIGVFNGTGETQNDVDTNDQKALVGRLVYKPASVNGLAIGTSAAWAPRSQTLNPQHHRLGFETVYQRDKVRLKSELMLGIDGDVHRRGFYAHGGYRFTKKIEGIFRFDMFDPNTGLESTPASVTERDYIGGLNYYIKDNNFKIQLNYLRKTFANNITPSKDLFIVNLQTAW